MQNELIEIEKEVEVKKEPDLEAYFKIEEHETEWCYFCKTCKKGWRLSKESIAPGNLLFLLNHARSHKKKTKHQ